MILELKRAVAQVIENNLHNIRCFANETVNENNYYPCIYIMEIERKQRLIGTGISDYVTHDSSGKAIKKSKIIEYHTIIRFLIEASGFIGKSETSEKSATEQVHEIDDLLNKLFIKIKRGKEKNQFIDPETNKNLNVTDIKFVTTVDIPEETDVDPILFRRSSSYKFIHRYHFDEVIKHTIEKINVASNVIKVI